MNKLYTQIPPFITIIDKRFGKVGRLLLPGHSNFKSTKMKVKKIESMLMPTVIYLRGVDCDHAATKKSESYRKL